MRKICFFYICISFFIVLVIHLISVNDYDLSIDFPNLILLGQINVITGCIPVAIYEATRINRKEVTQGKGLDYWVNRVYPSIRVNKNAPLWLNVLVYFAAIYALIDMMLVATMHPGLSAKTPGHPQYHYFHALQLRNFSGFWMLFHIVSATLLYPFKLGLKSNHKL